MTWQSAQDALHTRDCSVKGCTGITYSHDSDLCKWHLDHGTPDDIRSARAAVPTTELLAALQERLDDLDRKIGACVAKQHRLMTERRRVYRRLSRLLGDRA